MEPEVEKCDSNQEIKNEEAKDKKTKAMNTRRWCSVPMCKSRTYRSLHKFPRDPDLLKKWVIACRIGKKVTKNMIVCRDHFLPSDFIPRWDGRLRNLKKIAIPSQNLPTRPLDKKLTPAQLKRKEDRAARAARRLERVVPRILRGPPANKSPKENKSSKKTEASCVDEGDEDSSSLVLSKQNDKITDSEVYKEYKADVDTVEMDQENFEQYIAYAVCTCDRSKNIVQEKKECYEVKAVKVLLEFNEIVDQMMKSCDIIFPIKDIVLKRVEEFYQCARRSHKVSFYSLFKKDNQLHAFSGIDFKLLNILAKSVACCEELASSETELCIEEQILLSLVKLRWNLSFASLAKLFYIKEEDCTSIFHTMLQVLKSILKSAIYWPTQEEIMCSMPESLEMFKKTIMVVDRNEINVERLMCPQCDLPMNSEYTGSGKLKILLGFSQCGLITYVSKAQHDVAATNQTIIDPCLISKILVPSNDAIMTDGCFIEQDCNRSFIELIKSRTETPFDPESTRSEKSKESQSSSLHIDSAYKRFQKFRFLKSTVSSDEVSLIDDISVVICGIVNLGNPVIVKSFN